MRLGENLPGVELLAGEEPGTENPHLWMDVKYAELYVDRIAAALSQADAANATDYTENSAAYKQNLEQLDGWVRARSARSRSTTASWSRSTTRSPTSRANTASSWSG